MHLALLASLFISQTTTSTPTPSEMFVKGELAHAGVVRLIPKQSFIGVRIGGLVQETTLFLTLSPKIDLFFLEDRLKFGIEVPLNLELYNGRAAADAMEGSGGFDHLFRLREKDYDDARDFVKILRYITYGKKEDPVYLDVGQLFSTTIGHGQSMRRYTANLDINSTKVGASLDAYSDYGGFEMSVADVTHANLYAALAFIKPLALLSDHWLVRSLSVGAGWASDQTAPYRLQRGPRIGMAPVGPVLVDQLDTPLHDRRTVNLYSVDAELKVLKTESSDLKTYVDFSKLNNAGNGLTFGVLGRFNFRGESSLQLLRTRVELRSYSANYVPSYFDVLYEFQKIEYIPNAEDPGLFSQTKLEWVLNRPDDGRRFGVYLEASYALQDWFVVSAALELDTKGEDRHLMLHAEVPLSFLDVFATYHQRTFEKLFTMNINDVIFAGARLQILPFLFVNGRLQKNFAWDRGERTGLGGFRENFSVQFDAEIGYEF